MLVLSRKAGQEIVIQTAAGEMIRLKVSNVTAQGRVRIGIVADRETIIDRGEIYERRTGEKLPPLNPI